MAICLGLLNSIAFAQHTETATESSASGTQVPTTRSKSVDFLREIQPILRDNCYECHAGAAEEGGLNLGIKARVFRGGDSEAAIISGKSKESLLFQLVSGTDSDRLMPPEGNQPLSEEQIGLLRAWIDQGAQWPDDADVVDPKLDRAKTHWAFQRLEQTNAPSRQSDDDWSKSQIDLFVLRRLSGAGLRPSQPADARTLVRRLYFDLIGLPPTPKQTNRFILAHAEDPDSAVQDLVDQLLDSPRYGERWGRHWLDVARYADSDGQEADQDRPHAYTYRDFVIQAFNDDLPYDQFVRWQIAGDEFEPENDAAVAATGFLTAGPAFKLTAQRLEAEVMRDAMLAVSETLNLEAGGPGFKPYIAPEANLARNIKGEGYPEDAPDDATTRRRSDYMFHKHLIPYPMFQAFDRPDLMTSCARRQNTTVAPQAMVILNDRFVRSVARDFANLLMERRTSKSVPEEFGLKPIIEQAFETSFARLPTIRETETSMQFIQAQTKSRAERSERDARIEAVTDFCQSLFGLNEFIYVD